MILAVIPHVKLSTNMVLVLSILAEYVHQFKKTMQSETLPAVSFAQSRQLTVDNGRDTEMECDHQTGTRAQL